MPKGVYKRSKRKHAMNREQHQRASQMIVPVVMAERAELSREALLTEIQALKDRIAMLNQELGIARADAKQEKEIADRLSKVVDALLPKD